MAVYRSSSLLLLALLPAFVLSFEYKNLADVPCGESATGGRRQSRIVGGQDAAPGEFPWMVSITFIGGHICGGTILNSKFILTAAHCYCRDDDMQSVRKLRVTLGEHNRAAPEVPNAVTIAVESMIVHPGYKCGRYINDLALFELSSPIEWTESVRPACLPASAANSFAGESGVVAGWGWLGEDKAVYRKADILQKVDVNVLEDEMCNEWFASQGKALRLKYGQMCAGHEEGGRDACAADSGGPLMATGKNNKTLVIGVVSSGIGCARKRLPGLYTRISEFLPWIIENTQKK